MDALINILLMAALGGVIGLVVGGVQKIKTKREAKK